MGLKKEFKFLVLVGAWNQNIFTDQWIKKYLIPDDEFVFEVAIGGLIRSHRVSTDKYRIEFENGRISLIPIVFDLEIAELLIEMAVKLADYLPHTPVSGYGLNLVFEIEKTKFNKNLIKICDQDILVNDGIKYLEFQYKHRFKFDKFSNYEITLNVLPSKETCTFDFNYHSKINDLVAFKESIYELNFRELYQSTLDLLNDVYDISIIQ
ncbi:MAG: hypothetical protein K9K63_08705 [Desulfotignum sp.]|nr:hypothetical protein [Desulfotignum sp.]MCF8137374.1 hypothetical protein [Desulfotignum sp.]